MREAGYEVRRDRRRRPMLKDGRLRRVPRPRRGDRGRPACGSTRSTTPAHTPGSISFKVRGAPLLFTGDTLFPAGPATTKTDHGDFPTIIRLDRHPSLLTFPPTTIVLPGHGVDTTIGAERPHLHEWIDRGCERSGPPTRARPAAGIDPAKQPIPVAPAAHYHMGGIAVDKRGRTSIKGLWAGGEVSSTGAHGANRLASNSPLEAVAYAARIAEDIDGQTFSASRLSEAMPS